MTLIDKTFIGKKGEILPKKNLREVSGMNPGDKVMIEAYPNKMVIRKVLTMEEVFQLPILAKVKLENFSEEIQVLSENQEEMTNQKLKIKEKH